jgi:hypothetical protein
MRFCCFFTAFLLLSLMAEGQQMSSARQSTRLSGDDTLAINSYSRIMYHNYDIVNGPEYIVYHRLNHSNPFFQSATLSTGKVYSGRRIYNDYRLIYDIFKDELILNYLDPTGYPKLVSLNKHYIDSFDIILNNSITYRFSNILFKPEDNMKNGYYEMKFRGKANLLYKYLKTMTPVNGQDEYFDAIKKYIFINGEYHTITSLRKFYRLFGDKRVEMKKYTKSLQIISLKKITDIELLQIFAYYDSLK